jgi:NAD-dependent SIR2 family protein deacetylase
LEQAHGHLKTASCIDCHKPHSVEEFFRLASLSQVLYCDACHPLPLPLSFDLSKGIVKPDIIFFGEKLPYRFLALFDLIKEADLVVVMGTSLKVFPFASLVTHISPSTPLVVINREDPKPWGKTNYLFIPGDIEETIERITNRIGWDSV